MNMTRRGALALALAASTVGASRAGAECVYDEGYPPLRELVAGKGLIVGSAMSVQELNPDDRPLFARNLSGITPEVSLKMTAIRPSREDWRFAAADALLGFAAGADIEMRGHTLIWNNDQQPDWLNALSADEIKAAMQEHIERTMSRYAGSITVWDVVNEPIGEAQYDSYSLREGPFLARLGPAYIADALRMARAVAPQAKLVVNETHTERDDAFGLGYRRNLLHLIERLQDQGVPLDGIGLQGHLRSDVNFDLDAFSAFLAEIERRGLFIDITELDVHDDAFPDDEKKRDGAVANLYRRYLGRVLENRAVRTLTFWQLGDRASWYFSKSVYTTPESPRRPRPLLYDLRMRPKPALDAVVSALKGMPARKA